MVISILSFINLLSIGNFLNVPFSFFLFFFSSGERLIPSLQANKEKKSLSSKFLLSLDRVHDFSPLLFALPSLFHAVKKKKKKETEDRIGRRGHGNSIAPPPLPPPVVHRRANILFNRETLFKRFDVSWFVFRRNEESLSFVLESLDGIDEIALTESGLYTILERLFPYR